MAKNCNNSNVFINSLLQRGSNMYRYLSITVCLSASLYGSAQQSAREPFSREKLEDIARTQTIMQMHAHLVTDVERPPLTEINRPELQELNPFLFFACLPEELQQHTLTLCFNGNKDATKEFAAKPYATSLWLLAEYEQKPKPFYHLSAKSIFLLHPKQVAVVAEIEKQYYASLTAAPAPAAPAPVLPFFFMNQQPAYAQLTKEQVETLKTIPQGAIKLSPLNLKTIVDNSFNFKESCLDVVKSYIVDVDSKQLISLVTLTGKTIVQFSKTVKTMSQWLGTCTSFGIDVALLALLQHNLIPQPCSTRAASWMALRIGVDALGLCLASRYPNTVTAIIKFTVFPYLLNIGITLTSGIIFGARLATPYANRYTITDKKRTQKICTIL